MKLVHKGIKPTSPLQVLDFKRKLYFEKFDDGTYKIWTIRMLRSGCDEEVENPEELMGCLYCKHCDEYFSKDQYEERQTP